MSSRPELEQLLTAQPPQPIDEIVTQQAGNRGQGQELTISKLESTTTSMEEQGLQNDHRHAKALVLKEKLQAGQPEGQQGMREATEKQQKMEQERKREQEHIEGVGSEAEVASWRAGRTTGDERCRRGAAEVGAGEAERAEALSDDEDAKGAVDAEPREKKEDEYAEINEGIKEKMIIENVKNEEDEYQKSVEKGNQVDDGARAHVPEISTGKILDGDQATTPEKTDDIKRSPLMDDEHFKYYGGEDADADTIKLINDTLDKLEREIDSHVPDSMSYQDIDEFTESLLIFIKGFSQYGHTWKRLLEPPTVWRFVLKLIAESDDIKEEQSNVHQLSRTLAHMSEKSRYNSHSCIESCHDAEYFVKRILSILVPSDNWTAKIVCDTIDFLASSELGARLLVVNGAVRQIKDRINIGKDHAGSKSPIRVWHFSLKHVLQLLEKDENFEEWIDERMTKALAIRRSTDARFSYHESTCFLVAVLEILTGNNAIWKVMKNSYKHNPGKEKLSHRIVSRALNKLWSNPSKAFRTGVMMEFLEGMCLGLEVVDGIGGRSEILLEFMVNSDMEALRLFQFEYSIFNEHGNFKRTILRLSSKEIDNGKESYFLNGKTFSICPQFLAIYYTDIKASVHFLPLHLNTPSGVIQYELYSAISKTIDKQVLHVKTIILIDGEFWLINSGSKSRYTIRSIPNATVAVYEKKMDN